MPDKHRSWAMPRPRKSGCAPCAYLDLPRPLSLLVPAGMLARQAGSLGTDPSGTVHSPTRRPTAAGALRRRAGVELIGCSAAADARRDGRLERGLLERSDGRTLRASGGHGRGSGTAKRSWGRSLGSLGRLRSPFVHRLALAPIAPYLALFLARRRSSRFLSLAPHAPHSGGAVVDLPLLLEPPR